MSLSHLMLLLATLLAAFAPASRAQVTGPAGHWEGKIQIPDREMALAVDLTPGPAGA